MAFSHIEIGTAQPRSAIKVALLGNMESGKTPLALRLATDRFNPHTESTIGMAYSKKVISPNQESVGIEFWDISGNPKYEILVPLWIQHVPYIIVCVDPTKSMTTSDHVSLLKKIKTYSPKAHVSIAITKNDLKDTVDYQLDEVKIKNTIEKIIADAEFDKNKVSIHFVSAKTGKGVSELLSDILFRCNKLLSNSITRSETSKQQKSIRPDDSYKNILAPLDLNIFDDHDSRAKLIRIVLLWALNEGNINLAELIIRQQKNWMEGKEEVVHKEIASANLPNFEENKFKYQLYLFSPSPRNDLQKIKDGKSEFYNGLCEVEQSLKKLKA